LYKLKKVFSALINKSNGILIEILAVATNNPLRKLIKNRLTSLIKEFNKILDKEPVVPADNPLCKLKKMVGILNRKI